MKTLAELTSLLDDLENRLPQLIEQYPDDADFWMAFAGEADCITDSAGPEHAYVSGRINCMLSSQGLIPGENEGEKCD
jgi:hypothetical protein